MKKHSIFALAAFAFLTTACLDDSDPAPSESKEIVLENNEALPGTVASGSTLILSEGFDFSLNSAVRVKDGGTLVIEPGVTITATAGGSETSQFIAVEQGGKILAEGTEAQPIVLTAASKQPGAWGGLIIAGRAPINTGNPTTLTEIGDASYGGTDPNDNSGILKYLRVEYTGSQINSEKQHNGITFYGVGKGTTVDYIQAFKGKDDGIEFFGGTVDVSHVVVIGSQDDQFDFAEGWTGTASYVYLQQIEDATYAQDKGIEGDNLSSHNAITPVSNPTIQNLTIVGFPTVKNEDGETTDGIRIREGAQGSFSNVVIKGYGDNGVDARSLQTLQNIKDGSLSFSNLYVSTGGSALSAKIDDGEADPNGLADEARVILGNSLTQTEPSGAEFDSWKGSWVIID